MLVVMYESVVNFHVVWMRNVDIECFGEAGCRCDGSEGLKEYILIPYKKKK